MSFDTFREQAFAAALAPAREYRAAPLGSHPGTKAVLAFPSSFGWLVRALHKTGKQLRSDSRTVTLGVSKVLSITLSAAIVHLLFRDCQPFHFLR
jgi:hypothetical protein